MNRMTKLALTSAALAAVLVGCGGGAAPAAPMATPAASGAQIASPTRAPDAVIARGKEVFVEKICHTCHTVQGLDLATGMVGPELTCIHAEAAKILTSAEYRARKGTATTPEGYIRESILDPNAYVYPTCPTGPCMPNLMIQDFADTITQADLDALVAYLVTLE
jgi:nitric oxide reductase subunit C